jgi:hypothetical protein
MYTSGELLRYAIVEIACKDYEWAIRYLNKYDHAGLTLTHSQKEQVWKARRYRDECENFFASDWFKVLCELNSVSLVNTLRKRAVTEKRTISRHKL